MPVSIMALIPRALAGALALGLTAWWLLAPKEVPVGLWVLGLGTGLLGLAASFAAGRRRLWLIIRGYALVLALAALYFLATDLWSQLPGRSLLHTPYFTLVHWGLLATALLAGLCLAAIRDPGGLGRAWGEEGDAGTGGPGVSRGAAVAALVIMAGLIFGRQLLTYGEAYERDLMAYMTVADGMLQGRSLYAGIWDHKPPGVHLAYAASVAVFGLNQSAIFVMGLLTNLVTLLGCYFAGRHFGGRLAGLAAAGVWVVAGGDLILQANQPNVEAFMNCCLVWAVVLALRLQRGAAFPWWLAAGALFALATVFKTVAVTVAVLVLGAHVFYRFRAAQAEGAPWGGLRQGLRDAAWATGAAGAVWALVFLYFYLAGDFQAFNEAVFEYNRGYAGNIFVNILHGFRFSYWRPMYPYAGIMVLAMAALLPGVSRPGGRNRGILLAYLAGAWLAMALPGRFYQHYFQIFLPAVSVGAGWLVTLAVRGRRKAVLCTLCLVGVLPLAVALYQSSLPLDRVTVFKYGRNHGAMFRGTKTMAGWIDRLRPVPRVVYQWGGDPGVYFWSKRHCPSRFVYNFPLQGGSHLAGKYTDQVLRELAARPPDLIVANRLEMIRINHPVDEWIARNYRRVDGPPGTGHFWFYLPKAGGGGAH